MRKRRAFRRSAYGLFPGRAALSERLIASPSAGSRQGLRPGGAPNRLRAGLRAQPTGAASFPAVLTSHDNALGRKGWECVGEDCGRIRNISTYVYIILFNVMPRLVPGIHALLSTVANKKDVDGRVKPGHDERERALSTNTALVSRTSLASRGDDPGPRRSQREAL